MIMTTQLSPAPSFNDENPRVKFLCSFSGSILPRPQDGKLRYVGGETRIVSVPRDITYEELMGKIRELFEGAIVFKYQQPDEDLDALVSVMNDDDVTNMMEEYDKLSSCDGFTRLRIFLFSHSDQDGSVHFGDGDERESERRYVDALNSLIESPEPRKQQLSDFQVTGAGDDIHSAEQYFNQMNIEGSLHNQRNFDISIPQINLDHLTIPQMGSAQHQQSIMDASWSPMCYSPRHPGHLDSRPITEFPASPTSAVYRTPYGDFTNKKSDRIPEEYKRHPVNHYSSYDPQSRSDNLVYVPAGPVSGDKSCFPGNITHGRGAFEGNSICENCRVAFQRNQAYPDSTWKCGEPAQLEAPSVIENGFHPLPSPCGECLANREMGMLNAETKSSFPFYPRELNDPLLFCNETQTHDRGWILQPHLNSRGEEPRSHISGVGRSNDHYTIDSSGMNIPIVNGNLSDGHYLSQHYVHHEDPRLLRAGPDMANEVFHDQAFSTGSHIHISLEDRGVRYVNLPYGVDIHHQMLHGHVPEHTLSRNVHNAVHGAPSELSSFPQQAHEMVGPGVMRGTFDGSPMYPVAVESQSTLVESSQKMVGIDGLNVSEYSHNHSLKFNTNTYNQEHQCPLTQEFTQSTYDILNITAPSCPVPLTDSKKTLIGDNLFFPITSALEPRNDNQVNGSTRMEKDIICGEKAKSKVEDANMKSVSGLELNKNSDDVLSLKNISMTCLRPSMDRHGVMKGEENDVHVPCEDERPANVQLSFLSGLIESVNNAAIEGVQVVKASVQEKPQSFVLNETQKEEIQHEPEATEAQGEVELDSDNDNSINTKIEPTQAEAEAIAKGLQTIKNDDLEEIRELGSGTYGAVYYGKWRGSDVAIKRIKASCFAGKPSERDRLIADFWKEALTLSSLHHPNVVSFYGMVRDGSLATVTEFMINGSLKQFLRKKDRTIDRRKRLVIAMDAAFGMEYLHGKNIVHFDLKCENLLVNMRDPHRPVCKIGDLGLSKVKQHTLVSGGVRGTIPWMAPELLSGKSNMVTEKIDVYSFGVVMWELLTGDEPYADMHCASIIGGILSNSLRPEIPSWCDPEWKALMESCWASDPAQRPSFSEISQRLRNMAAAINVK